MDPITIIATILMVLGCILIFIFIVALILVIKLIMDIRSAVNSFEKLVKGLDKGFLSFAFKLFNIIKKVR